MGLLILISSNPVAEKSSDFKSIAISLRVSLTHFNWVGVSSSLIALSINSINYLFFNLYISIKKNSLTLGSLEYSLEIKILFKASKINLP